MQAWVTSPPGVPRQTYFHSVKTTRAATTLRPCIAESYSRFNTVWGTLQAYRKPGERFASTANTNHFIEEGGNHKYSALLIQQMFIKGPLQIRFMLGPTGDPEIRKTIPAAEHNMS